MSSRKTNNIEALSEQLGSLKIMEEASNKYKQTTTEEILAAPAPAAIGNSKNVQAGMLSKEKGMRDQNMFQM